MNASRREISSSGRVVELGGTRSFNSLGGTLGHHWVWKSGFSLALGLGLNMYTAGATTVQAVGTDPPPART